MEYKTRTKARKFWERLAVHLQGYLFAGDCTAKTVQHQKGNSKSGARNGPSTDIFATQAWITIWGRRTTHKFLVKCKNLNIFLRKPTLPRRSSLHLCQSEEQGETCALGIPLDP